MNEPLPQTIPDAVEFLLALMPQETRKKLLRFNDEMNWNWRLLVTLALAWIFVRCWVCVDRIRDCWQLFHDKPNIRMMHLVSC